MRILITGKYEPVYNRNKVLLSGLQKSGAELTEFPYSERNRSNRRKIRELAEKADLIFLPSFTHLDVPYVRAVSNKPMIFDPLISRYLSKVFDYKAVWRYSPRAYKNYLKDKVSFQLADMITADTQSHKDYYCRKFHIDEDKIFVLPVGVNRDDFFPLETDVAENDVFTVGFYGSFIPLHGLDKIIKAASILREYEKIIFRIYGDGKGFKEIFRIHKSQNLKNLSLEGWARYEDLNSIINSFDLCLGIFGDSLKADLVIPNKIYHYSACGKACLTKASPAIREIFTDKEDILLSPATAENIAENILEYSGKKEELKKIAGASRTKIIAGYNEDKIAGLFLRNAEKLLQQKS